MSFIFKSILASFIFSLFFLASLQVNTLLSRSTNKNILGVSSDNINLCNSIYGIYRQYCTGSTLPNTIGSTYSQTLSNTSFEPKGVMPSLSSNEIIITWTTTAPSKGYIQYGTTPASLLLSAPSRDELQNLANYTNHRVSIKTFKPNTTYYFRIRSGTDITSYTGWQVFDYGGLPYSFKTKSL